MCSGAPLDRIRTIIAAVMGRRVPQAQALPPRVPVAGPQGQHPAPGLEDFRLAA